jgi:hypothetical protein
MERGSGSSRGMRCDFRFSLVATFLAFFAMVCVVAPWLRVLCARRAWCAPAVGLSLADVIVEVVVLYGSGGPAQPLRPGRAAGCARLISFVGDDVRHSPPLTLNLAPCSRSPSISTSCVRTAGGTPTSGVRTSAVASRTPLWWTKSWPWTRWVQGGGVMGCRGDCCLFHA